MNTYRSKSLTFHWPPVIYIISNMFALFLDYYSSLNLPRLQSPSLWLSGFVAAILGVCLDIWAVKTLIASDTTIMPHRAAKHLVTRGPFGFTRNPSYVAYTVITASFAFLTGNTWFLVAAIFAAVATHFIAIHHEERHLLARFGCEFEYYCKHTRRWI